MLPGEGDPHKVIAEPQVIAKILVRPEKTAPEHYQPALPLGARAPPVQSSLI